MPVQNLQFETRPADQSIVFTGEANGAQSIVANCPVTLRKGDIEINVEVTDVVSPTELKGVVRDFVGHDGATFEGISVGDVIPFTPDHVFNCEL